MNRSVAQGRAPDSDATPWVDPSVARWVALVVGTALVLVAFVVYTIALNDRYYDHFVWQASAFLEGQAAIRYPVPGNEGFQDVLPVAPIDGIPRGLLPFPPLPAIVLLPFVAIWGFGTNDQLVFATLGAVDVGLCWWMLGRLRVRRSVRLGTTVFFAFGTVFWYTAQLATTWFQAHVLGVGLTLLAVGIAIGGDRVRPDAVTATDRTEGPTLRDRFADLVALDGRQLVAGLLFGLACTARLTVVFGAPFFLVVGSGGSVWRRGWSAGVGAAIPVLALVAYNLATTGHVFHPAYDYLYRLEATVYWPLGYNRDWSIEDVRYLPQNIGIMLAALPAILPSVLPDSLGANHVPLCTAPDAARGLFDVTCPIAVPRDIGTSLLVTSPALLLALPALRRIRVDRLVAGSVVAILLIAIVNLMHFSQGWVQFGYRFSNDFVPWALVLVALGWERFAHLRAWMAIGVVLVVVSIAVNLWGVLWGRILGW